MFNISQKVVCVNIDDEINYITDDLMYLRLRLELYKIYTIRRVYPNKMFVLLNETVGAFFDVRFVPLKEYRKQKLNKICSI